MNGLQRAVEIAGGQTALAALLGPPIKQAHVWWWLEKMDGRVPPQHCAAIERATEGKVTRHDLRPDIFGEPPALLNSKTG